MTLIGQPVKFSTATARKRVGLRQALKEVGSDGCLVAPWSRKVQPRDEWRDDFRPAPWSICFSQWISPEWGVLWRRSHQ